MVENPKIAFIGTGIMGAPIAGHIMDAGYDMTIYNRTKSKAEALIERGAHWADTVEAAVADADVVFTMLGFPGDVEEVYLSSSGLLRKAKKGAYLIDLTTTSPELARDIAEAATVEGYHAFDCPVTGGESGAISGTLTLIIGAAEKDVEPVRRILETFGKSLRYFGRAGQGQLAKLANQIALACSMMGMAEALSFASVNGLDQEAVRELILSGTGTSGAMLNLGGKVLDGDYKPGFLVEHFLKDIGLALQTAQDGELRLPATETAFNLYDMLDCIGGARLGTQAIALLYQEEADAVAAGLDWSLYTAELENPAVDDEEECCDEYCDCGADHKHHHDNSCSCGCEE